MAEAWLRRWLFRGTLAVAGLLTALVAVAPWLAPNDAAEGWRRVLALFGHDEVLRRTSLASAAGLAATAFAFFHVEKRP